MLRDARDLQAEEALSADVCIVGAGAAGIALALELEGSGLDVVLLESGGRTEEAPIQALYAGDNAGVPLDLTRVRQRWLGGTTNSWAGWSRPLDADDFEARDFIPHSGWPLSWDDLAPYWGRALALCQAGALQFDAEAIYAEAGRTPLPVDPARVETVVYQYSPPTRFGTEYADELEAAGDVRLYLHANLVEIVLADGGGRVSKLRCATLQGTEFEVNAGQVVLAMGGMETPRIMLASNRQEPAGVGNGNDLVGRYWMEHAHFYGGAHLLLDPGLDTELFEKKTVVPTFDDEHPDGLPVKVRAALALPLAVRQAEGLPTLAGTMGRVRAGDEPGRTGRLDAAVVRPLLRDAGEAPPLFAMTIRSEQLPNPDSRVRLGEERDALGLPRLVLDWKVTDADHGTVHRSLELIGAELGRAGVGRLWMPLDAEGRYRLPRISGGGHHMGGTRMSASPETGVVDADCRVHGLDNLFVSGAQVFATGGFANPVITLLALAFRLADKLKEVAS